MATVLYVLSAWLFGLACGRLANPSSSSLAKKAAHGCWTRIDHQDESNADRSLRLRLDLRGARGSTAWARRLHRGWRTVSESELPVVER